MFYANIAKIIRSLCYIWVTKNGDDMIAKDVELIYENCECVTIKAAAVDVMLLRQGAEEIYYNPNCNVTEPTTEKFVNEAWMILDLSDPSMFSDNWEDEDPIKVLKERRDICGIIFEGMHYHVEWFSPDSPDSPLMYTNAYQDPAKLNGSKLTIKINARRPRPQYQRALWWGNYIYVAEHEASSCFTRRYKLAASICGQTEIAVAGIQESDTPSLNRIYYIERVYDIYPEEKPWLNADLFLLRPQQSPNHVNFVEEETGLWALKTLPPEGELEERQEIVEVDHLEMDARFPVFRRAFFVPAPGKTIVNHLVDEVKSEIDRKTLSDIAEAFKN